MKSTTPPTRPECSADDTKNVAIFEALNSVLVPNQNDIRRLCDDDIVAAGKHDILEFRPHDNYLNVVRTRFLISTYSLNAIGDAAAELPLT
jgi:hypothetical protein